jgi:hypothetical protein
VEITVEISEKRGKYRDIKQIGLSGRLQRPGTRTWTTNPSPF